MFKPNQSNRIPAACCCTWYIPGTFKKKQKTRRLPFLRLWATLSHMLPASGCKVKYFRENTAGISCPRSISGLLLRILRVLAVFGGSFTAETSGLAVCRGSLLRILSAFQVFRGFVLRVLQIRAVFPSVGTASTASTRSTKILSICPAYSEYEVYYDHLTGALLQLRTVSII